MTRMRTSHRLPRLREWRVARCMSIRRLAYLSRTSTETIQGAERGRRTHPYVRARLAEALEVDPLQLMFSDDQIEAVLTATEGGCTKHGVAS